MAIVDLAKTGSEASFVRKALKKFGLPSDIGGAIAALAFMVRDHKHLENLLTGIGPEERQMVYDSIVPHLRFKARPLDVYVSNVGQRAEREQWPVLEDGKFKEFKPAQDLSTVQKHINAEIAKKLLILTCSKCTCEETFFQIGEETRVDTILKARKAGWVYDLVNQKEICPKCPTSLRPNA